MKIRGSAAASLGRPQTSVAIDVDEFCRYFIRTRLTSFEPDTADACEPTFSPASAESPLTDFKPMSADNIIAAVGRPPDKRFLHRTASGSPF
jgi:hypothetical protein